LSYRGVELPSLTGEGSGEGPLIILWSREGRKGLGSAEDVLVIDILANLAVAQDDITT
jgi:hypothetical protein